MRDRVPTIAVGAISKLVGLVEQAGEDPAPLLAQVGLEPAAFDDADARVPVEQLHALWEAVLEVVPDAASAVLGAGRYSPSDYGLVGFVAMNSRTLGEAIRHAVRYLGLWTDEPSIALSDDGTLSIVYRCAFADRLGLRMATEATPAELLNGARVLTQRHLVPREVRFRHPPPRDPAAHHEFFGCQVRFGASDNAMLLDRTDLELSLPKADEKLGAYLRTLANQALQAHCGPDPSPLDRIRQIIAEQLQREVPSLSEVARALAISDRTLRRRLEAEGTSYRALLDETRARLAKSYVADRRLSLSEVAFLVGFSEPSAFHRAFKRWTGSTPSAYRARS